MEAMNIGAVNSRRNPGGWRELPAMRMATKQQRDSRLFGDGQAMRCVRKQDAWPLTRDRGLFQNDAKLSGVAEFEIMYSNELQPLEFNFFIIQDANAGLRDGLHVSGAVGEFFVVAAYEKSAERHGKARPRLSQGFDIGPRSVVHITGEKHHVWPKLIQPRDDSAHESKIADVSEMRIACECGNAPHHEAGKFGSFIVIRFTRTRAALISP